jgi:DnaJ-class molecular chaperone
MKDKILMPVKLTQEVLECNFINVVEVECVICAGIGIDPFNDKCDMCKGDGKYKIEAKVTSAVITAIYSKAVEVLGTEVDEPIKKKGRGSSKGNK